MVSAFVYETGSGNFILVVEENKVMTLCASFPQKYLNEIARAISDVQFPPELPKLTLVE